MWTGRQCGYDTTVRTVLFSLLVNITFQHLVLIFGPNSGLTHPRRTAMSVYVSCLYSYYNGVIYSYRDGKGHSSEFFKSQVPRYILFGSPQAHESDVCVVRRTRCSVPPPKPDEETKYSAERGWNPGLYRFLYRPASRTGECWCFTKPF